MAGPGFIETTRVTTAGSGATEIEVRFNCKVHYLRHDPQGGGDRLRIYVEPTGICNGVPPSVAESRSRIRPANADDAGLLDLEYDGDSTIGSVITLNFNEPVDFSVDAEDLSFALTVLVRPSTGQSTITAEAPDVRHRQVPQPAAVEPEMAINLASFRRIPTVADAPGLPLDNDQRLYYTRVVVDGTTWYRLRLGDFASGDEAITNLALLRDRFPEAWIDRADNGGPAVELVAATDTAVPTLGQVTESSATGEESAPGEESEADALMAEARRLMVAGDTSRAIQYYTKVLQLPDNPRQMEAQEYLALAREKNGQTAHAKAEYERYLALYPDSEGATRVSQRLAAMLASNRQAVVPQTASSGGAQSQQRSDWRLLTYFSQYYRRDANQLTEQEEIVSQSAIYSDVNFDARRRGQRFDFSSRISAGYRNDLLGEEVGSGDQLRVSYAYADLADSVTGIRGRIGRQSRATGGVLGRFDGLNLAYHVTERTLVEAVVGKPAYSSTEGLDPAITFYGVSADFQPFFENLEVGTFFLQQDIEGIRDRQVVGTEVRYFGPNQTLWGMIDYDLGFGEIASGFLQGSWRFPSRFSIHGLVDRRGSPFMSVGNAIIGQPVLTFAELTSIFTEDELRQLGRDRTSMSTTFTLGVSYPLSPKLQINIDASQSEMEGTPASGGVLATEATSYNYYSANLVASSLFTEGDVTIVGARYSDSDTSQAISLSLDSRFPIGRSWRINPRLRVDRRNRLNFDNYEWLYTPGIRIQYRRSQKFRIELEAGRQYVQQDAALLDNDRESTFFNIGYQAFF
jgi:tetratricopeptide (TPR) repeat protein